MAERDQTAVQFLPGAEETLDVLADRYQLGLVTNGDPDLQRPKIRSRGIDDYFETVVFAGIDAPYKPDPEPFHLALDDLGRGPRTHRPRR